MTATVAFWQPEVFVGEPATFQLSLTPLPGALRGLTFTSVHLYWDEHEPPIVLNHSEECAIDSLVQLGELDPRADRSPESRKELEASLRWDTGRSKTFAGSIIGYTPSELKVNIAQNTKRVF